MKLVQTKDYLLWVDDLLPIQEMKQGDKVFSKYGYKLRIAVELDNTIGFTGHKGHSFLYFHEDDRKTLAYSKLNETAEELDLPLLPNPYQYVLDINVLFKAKYPKLSDAHKKDAFVEGYNAAQSKQFSLEDMQKAIEWANEKATRYSFNWVEKNTKSYLQSLSTQQLPKEFITEIETVTKGTNEFDFYEEYQLKIITNSEGKQQLVGTYKY